MEVHRTPGSGAAPGTKNRGYLCGLVGRRAQAACFDRPGPDAGGGQHLVLHPEIASVAQRSRWSHSGDTTKVTPGEPGARSYRVQFAGAARHRCGATRQVPPQ